MRSCFALILLFLMSGAAHSQLSNPEPPSGASHDAVSPASSDHAPVAAPPKQNVEQTLAAACQDLEHGKPQEAITILEQLAATQGPSTKGVQHELGIAYYRTGKLLSAEQAFARAISEDANDMESVQMRGLTLYRLGRPADAIPFLERVKQWTPNANADANYVLGLCYLNSQRFDEARVAFANQFNSLCRPSFANPNESFGTGAGPFNPITHSVSYFTPVATLTAVGQVEGPGCDPLQEPLGPSGAMRFGGRVCSIQIRRFPRNSSSRNG